MKLALALGICTFGFALHAHAESDCKAVYQRTSEAIPVAETYAPKGHDYIPGQYAEPVNGALLQMTLGLNAGETERLCSERTLTLLTAAVDGWKSNGWLPDETSIRNDQADRWAEAIERAAKRK